MIATRDSCSDCRIWLVIVDALHELCAGCARKRAWYCRYDGKVNGPRHVCMAELPLDRYCVYDGKELATHA